MRTNATNYPAFTCNSQFRALLIKPWPYSPDKNSHELIYIIWYTKLASFSNIKKSLLLLLLETSAETLYLWYAWGGGSIPTICCVNVDRTSPTPAPGSWLPWWRRRWSHINANHGMIGPALRVIKDRQVGGGHPYKSLMPFFVQLDVVYT
jgi:hypothetical protein